MSELVPPHDQEIEASLLGSVLLSEKVLSMAVSLEGVRAESFYRPRYQTIFRAMLALSQRGEKVDATTVASEFGHDDKARAEVHALPTMVQALGSWQSYARRLVELARFREQFVAARDLMVAAATGDQRQVVEAEAQLAAGGHHLPNRRRSREQRQHAVLEIVEGRGQVWRTPFLRLNELLAGGLRPGQLTILGGPPSHGKSLLATQLLEHFHTQDAKCALYTNEMETDELDLREIARQTATVSHWSAVQGKIRDEEWPEVLAAVERLGESFEVIEAAGMTAEEIAYDIRRERWDVAVVDLLNGLPKSTEVADIDSNVATLAACSRQARCQIIACQHLNQHRHAGKEYPPIPVASDIRGSGAIHNLANNVLFVYLRESDFTPGEPSNDGLIRVAKARGGMRGMLDVAFQPSRMRFLPPHDEEAKAA